MQKVRLGIIGLGNIGKYHADYLQSKRVSRCELVAVCDAVAPLDRYAPLKIFTDGEALIRSGEVDAVILCTPTQMHAQQAIACMKAGKHVYCEKPVSTTLAEAMDLLRAAKRARVKHGVVQDTILTWPSIAESFFSTLAKLLPGERAPVSAALTKPTAVPAIVGCCVLVRAEALRDVGLFVVRTATKNFPSKRRSRLTSAR